MATGAGSNLENTLKVSEIMYLNGFTNAKSIYIVRSDSSEVYTTTNIIFYKLAHYCSRWSVLLVRKHPQIIYIFVWHTLHILSAFTLLKKILSFLKPCLTPSFT